MISATSGRTTALRVLVLAGVLGATVAGASPVRGRPKSTEAIGDAGTRLCAAVQKLPETRKAGCCSTTPSTGLAAQCTRELDRSLRDGALSLDPADVDRCAKDSAHALDGCDWVTPYLPAIPASCRGILHGRRDVRAACRSSLECRDGLRCVGNTPSGPGVCVPPGPPGASCSGAPDLLATFLRQTDDDTRHPECAGFCLRGRCAPFVSAGGECAADRQCAPGSHCASRRCVAGPRPRLGEACEGSPCNDGLVCSDGRCAPPKKAGEPCTHPFECEATCLSPTADKGRTCGTQCSAWPPAGYTAPVAN
jgi:hypothetical protein